MDSRRNFIGKFAGGIAGTLADPKAVLRANERVRVGLIGAGERGVQLAWEAQSSPAVEIIAVADIYKARLERSVVFAPEARQFEDYRRLLEAPNLDAVVIATPQHLHCEHFLAALDAGKHVYVERALALTAEDAGRMRARGRSSPHQIVQVGHQLCSSGLMDDALRFLSAGWVGEATALEATHHRNAPRGRPTWSQPVYPDMTAENIDWEAFLGTAPGTEFDADRYLNWRKYWDYSGGNIHEGMSQQLAFWYSALGLEIPSEVTAIGGVSLWNDGREVPDTLTVAMRHRDGFHVNWSLNSGNSQLGVREHLLGTDGAIQRGQQVRYYPQRINRPGGRETLGRAKTEPRAHVRNFLDCVRSGSVPNCPLEVGYRVSVACAMAVRSLRERCTVYWDRGREMVTAVPDDPPERERS